MNNKKIVCLGGGIGTSNVIKGLSKYTKDITVAVSMADEGGSSGRLRRLYNVLPPGDIVSCMAAFCSSKNELVSRLLTYRFPGDRYGEDGSLSGHKLGNLILVAMRDITGSFEGAIKLFQKTFAISGVFLPASVAPVQISVKTKKGIEVFGEERIDRGDYDWRPGIDTIMLHPNKVKASHELLEAMQKADCIIAGPGDLYTTTLPVLLVNGIKDALKKSTAKKLFIVNITNKPFETKGYTVTDYIAAVIKSLGFFPFSVVIVNTNIMQKLMHQDSYSYVEMGKELQKEKIQYVAKDLISMAFPFHHDYKKLAKAIVEQL